MQTHTHTDEDKPFHYQEVKRTKYLVILNGTQLRHEPRRHQNWQLTEHNLPLEIKCSIYFLYATESLERKTQKYKEIKADRKKPANRGRNTLPRAVAHKTGEDRRLHAQLLHSRELAGSLKLPFHVTEKVTLLRSIKTLKVRWRLERNHSSSIQAGEKLKGQSKKVNPLSHPAWLSPLLWSLFFWELPGNWNPGKMTVVEPREQLRWRFDSKLGRGKCGASHPSRDLTAGWDPFDCCYPVPLFLFCGRQGDSRREEGEAGGRVWELLKLSEGLVGWDNLNSSARLTFPLLELAMTQWAKNMDTSRKGAGEDDTAIYIPLPFSPEKQGSLLWLENVSWVTWTWSRNNEVQHVINQTYVRIIRLSCCFRVAGWFHGTVIFAAKMSIMKGTLHIH